ncbi:thiamine-phosphate kinase [Desulfovermiculus halophilus]|jgi:thiamine-monophosphate kinase|uniref:thiamine-phosphate kinase n=1 Tax=Desulfovermiculus halophilus TaxID=339722 RepID=UPI00054FD3FF|nr:thiamine-phosphate kinase [Desulfovermiculus halophilus]
MPSLADVGEFGFIQRISGQCLVRSDRVHTAIGDDAAAYWTDGSKLALMTTDMLVEGVHFIRTAASPFSLGWKSVAVNMSDIAAMGGSAGEAFISLAIPKDCSMDYLDELYRGMHDICVRFGVNILGGDTTSSTQGLVINVALTGEVAEEEILCRDRAQPGDLICCTGPLGDSRAGLHLITSGLEPIPEEFEPLYQAHIAPWPCLEEGRFLASSRALGAAIDVSDGVSSDLQHICTASGTGARVYAADMPLSQELTWFCSRFGFDPLEWALAGGEDYVLLFTVRPEKLDAVQREYAERFRPSLAVIGEMTAGGEPELVDASGRVRPITSTGWNHFRGVR